MAHNIILLCVNHFGPLIQASVQEFSLLCNKRQFTIAHWEIWLCDCLPDKTANHHVRKQIIKLPLEKIWKKPYNLDLIDPDLSSKYVETVNAYLKSNYTLPFPKLTY